MTKIVLMYIKQNNRVYKVQDAAEKPECFQKEIIQ
jgi:hypothetical protein